MPKLSGYLTSQLANPAYSGMLSQGVAQGMQGISNAIAENRQKRAWDSMSTMLTGADPSDPNVIQSVQAVGRQMNQDPLAVRELIMKAQDQQMQKESAARAKEQHQWGAATAKWQEHLRTEALRKDNAIKAGMAVYAKTGDEEKALQSVPPEYQDQVRQRFANKLRYDLAKEKHEEYLKAGEPVDEELLKYYESLSPEAEQAVQTYRKQLETGVAPRTAAASLKRFVDEQQRRTLYPTKKTETKPKAVNASDIKAAEAYITTLGIETVTPSWMPALFGNKDLSEEQLAIAAHKLAYEMKNNPDREWNKEAVTSVVRSAFAETQSEGKGDPSGNIHEVGDVVDGYKFIGGDDQLEENWRKVDG